MPQANRPVAEVRKAFLRLLALEKRLLYLRPCKVVRDEGLQSSVSSRTAVKAKL